jgi:hypothetical protein
MTSAEGAETTGRGQVLRGALVGAAGLVAVTVVDASPATERTATRWCLAAREPVHEHDHLARAGLPVLSREWNWLHRSGRYFLGHLLGGIGEYGDTSSSSGDGVFGASGGDGNGVHGSSRSDVASGVYGDNSALGYGVAGRRPMALACWPTAPTASPLTSRAWRGSAAAASRPCSAAPLHRLPA